MNDLFDKSRRTGARVSEDRAASAARAADRRVIAIRGAREHNLKNVDVEIPRDQLVVFTGLSGSGKSSLAFDTIYAEGQRRYVELLSAYARQFLEMMQKPDVDQIDGLSPAISIEQKTTSRNPRSTVGTVTEIYDYMRLLWARIGVPYSPATGLPIESQTVSQMVDRVLALPEGTRIYLLAPVVRGRKGEYRKELAEYLKKGYQRVKIDGAVPRDRRGQAARQEVHPRHRRGGRPPGGAARHRDAARGFTGAGAQARRRHGGGRAGRFRAGRRRQGQQAAQRDRRAADLLREIRLPGVRLHHFRDRAAAVLVQQSVRRLPGLRRPRRRAAHRRRSGHPRQGRDLAQGRDRALGQVVEPVLRPDAGGARQALPLHARLQVEGPGQEDAGGDPLRLRRGRDQVLLRRRHARLPDQEAVRGRHHQPGAPLPRDRERLGARGAAEVLHRHSLRGLQGLPAQARGAVRQDRGQAHRRSLRNVDQARRRMVHRPARRSSRPSRTRSRSGC